MDNANRFSNSELVDIVLAYGEARQNARLAERIYAERFPQRRHPNHRMFVGITQRLRDTGSLRPNHGRGGGPRQVRNRHIVEDAILNAVHVDPTISTRRISRLLHVPHSSVWRTIRNHPYHF